MNVSMLQTISILGFAFSAVFLIIAAIMFFLMDIPGVIGILSGKTAEKEIQMLREQNRKMISEQIKNHKKPEIIEIPVTNEDTMLLDKEEETTVLHTKEEGYRLIFDVVEIHTGERI